MKLSNKTICFLDLETTGLVPRYDKIVEIALILSNKEENIYEEYHQYINPGIHIPNLVSNIHGIFDNDVADKPKLSDIIDDILLFIGRADFFAAHNGIGFDKPFLIKQIKKTKREIPENLLKPWIDTYYIFKNEDYKTVLGNPKNLKLQTIAQLFGIKFAAHNALEDTLALARVFSALLHDDMIPDDYEALLLAQANVKDVDYYLGV